MLAFHNQVQLIGRAGHVVELTQLSDGSYRATLRLYQHTHPTARATEEAQVYTLIAWNSVATQLHERVRRGDRLMVQGKLVNRKLTVRELTVVKSEIHVAFFTVLATRSMTRSVGVAAEPEPTSFSRP